MKKRLFNRLFPLFNEQECDLQTDKDPSSEGESISEAKDRLECALNTAPVAYAVVVDNLLTEVNEYARNHIGMEQGQDIRQFFEDLEQWNLLTSNAGSDKQTVIRIIVKTGNAHRFLGSITAADYHRQKSYILWGINIEETELENERMRELLNAAEKEKDLNRLEGKILTDISREIENPINVMLGITDLLLGEEINGRQMHYITDIKKMSETLLGVVDGILDYAKMCEGNIHITPVNVELGAFLKNIVSMTRFSARTKGLKFIDEINIKSPEYVKVDETRLKQAIMNLLSNAIKFTRAGSVKFCVNIDSGNILFTISDTGIGVKPEDIPLVFTAFSRVDERKNRLLKGTGLGLSISEKLIELMGGKIWLESEYGVGSHFYVSIPYVSGDEAVTEASGTETEYIYAPTASILLVDDIQANLTVTAGLLHLYGINADVVMSGMEAIKLVCEKDYDIIFMDYMMPQMDGVEAMKRIRDLGERYAKLPIIALTAGSADESRDFLLGAGMNDFLSKPLDKNALIKVLRKWIPISKFEAVADHDATTNRDPINQSSACSEILKAASLIEGVDIQLALSRISGMQDVLEKSLTQVAKSIDGSLSKMKECLSGNNLKDFSIAVHGIKSSLAHIGAMRHSELAAELEALSKSGNVPQCMEKFPVFFDMTSDLAIKLNAILPQPDVKDLPQGDRSLLTQKAKTAISLLEEYEIVEARACLQEMLAFTYDEATDKLLKDASDAVETANYKNAIALFKSFVL